MWIIPIGFAVYDLGNYCKNSEGFVELIHSRPNFLTTLSLLGALGVVVFFQSLIPFVLVRIILHYIKKPLLRNSKIITVENFDYYRDKLTGLSPAAISMLADLNIEKKKDISASILKYQDMGILRYENSRYIISGDYHNAPLRESDRYLIEGLAGGGPNVQSDMKWERLVENEAVEDGLITSRFDPLQRKENQKRVLRGCLGGCLTPIILWIMGGALLFSVDLDYFDKAFSEALTDGELVVFMNQNPKFCITCLLAVFAICIFIIALVSPVTILIGKIAGAFGSKPYKRTELGNQMAEYVFGMKNFIHDYSNLSEAEQEHVALWNDYLVYAVVLEENSRITDEIMKRRRRK